MRKGPEGTLECPGGRRNAVWAMGWALAIPILGTGRVAGLVPGIAPSQHPPSRTTRVLPLPYPPPVPHHADATADALNSSLQSTKEILGVEYALLPARYRSGPARITLRRPRRPPGPALWGLL